MGVRKEHTLALFTLRLCSFKKLHTQNLADVAEFAISQIVSQGLDVARPLQFRDAWMSSEVPRPLFYKGVNIDCTYRIDLLVENTLVVGLLFNFHVAQLIQGLKSIVNPSAE